MHTPERLHLLTRLSALCVVRVEHHDQTCLPVLCVALPLLLACYQQHIIQKGSSWQMTPVQNILRAIALNALQASLASGRVRVVHCYRSKHTRELLHNEKSLI